MERLCASLSYQFRDTELLRRALRHCSAGKDNNERLEFLGDAVLGMIVSELLFQHYPAAPEGELSRLRAALVQQSTLAELARGLALGQYLSLGQGELKSGGANRDSILADAFEALISALYLDGGYEACATRVRQWFLPLLARKGPWSNSKDPKTRLQEYMQARKLPLPHYSIREIAGRDHSQRFHVDCQVTLLREPVTGSGQSRKEAEQKAARLALTQLGADDD
ncbi:MAG: ribonuclease III [Pseudomonadales bacterium]|jgi:ribonuclease-3|nr:ribonuclease III [Pseudomonadales bacterium]